MATAVCRPVDDVIDHAMSSAARCNRIISEPSSNCDTPFRSERSRLAVMTTREPEFDLEISRRRRLLAAGIGGGAVVATSLIGAGVALSQGASAANTLRATAKSSAA